ncbi:hypothetical protein BPNPMPFG_003619 [Mesorhizobium sp. AR07]|uniref:hypothetical protein n=1 Tax=Mesorhizobium sp. AR07 TaxID=2865838 RepID=UPI002160E874|nr:hypothetical protein [Mesorhizobium sp. AR07]UVK41993.1 hypothetical protein BPNPMPFG_003619 [Mesorhizobium sp. AR07]
MLVAINPLGTGVAVAAALKPMDDNAGDTTSFGKCASLVRSHRYPKENGIRTFSRLLLALGEPDTSWHRLEHNPHRLVP